MKNAILESLFLLSCSILCGSGLFLIECPAWLQNSFLVMMVVPSLWFIPKRIFIEMKK
jgi:hypothetical protein